MLVLALLLTFLHNNVQIAFCDKTPITCNAGAFSAGAPASVVCNFHRDVSVDQLAAIVEHFPKNATAATVGTEVLKCQRTDLKSNYDCELKDGFKFDGVIKEHLTLRIPFVNSTFAGMYMCFFEPAETTDPQLCELSLKAPITVKTTSPHEGGSGHMLSIVIPIIVVLALFTIIVMAVINKRRLRRLICKNRQRETQNYEDSSTPMIGANDQQSERPSRLTNKLNVDIFLKGLTLTDSHYQHGMELMAQELVDSSKGHSQWGVKTYNIPVHSLPDGTEDGTCLVAELGSTTVKVCRVLLWGFRTDIEPRETYPIPSEIRSGTGLQLFSFIADCMKQFLVDNKLSEKKFRLGFIFSFPCAQDQELTKATITEWTKGFVCNDVLDKDVGELLQQALNDKFAPCFLYVRTVCNDAVGTLIAVASKDTSCKIAVMLGTGFNACCMQERTNSSVVSHDPKVLTKIELGMLGKNESLDSFTTKYDREVDGCSVHPGKHVLEKMVSMMYIGEVVRFVLRTLIHQDLLFHSVHNKHTVLTAEGAFTADFVSLAESDTSEDYLATKFLLKQLHVENYTDEDCNTVVYVCQVVLKRAAYLAAAGLAALINHMHQIETNGNNQHKVTIAVDGDLHRYHPNFHKLLLAKTQELVKPGLQLEFHPLFYGSIIGTALVTATLLKPSKTPASKSDGGADEQNQTKKHTQPTNSRETSDSKQPTRSKTAT